MNLAAAARDSKNLRRPLFSSCTQQFRCSESAIEWITYQRNINGPQSPKSDTAQHLYPHQQKRLRWRLKERIADEHQKFNQRKMHHDQHGLSLHTQNRWISAQISWASTETFTVMTNREQDSRKFLQDAKDAASVLKRIPKINYPAL